MSDPNVQYLRVKAFSLEPIWEHCPPDNVGGLLNIDGERYGRCSIEVECHRGMSLYHVFVYCLFSAPLRLLLFSVRNSTGACACYCTGCFLRLYSFCCCGAGGEWDRRCMCIRSCC